MVYAMFSIGILGCLVWSIETVALLFSDKKVIKLHYLRKKKINIMLKKNLHILHHYLVAVCSNLVVFLLCSIELGLIIITLNKFTVAISPFTALSKLSTTNKKVIRCQRAKIKNASQRKTISTTNIKRTYSNLASETLRGASFNFTEFYKAHKYIEPN